MAYLLQNGSKQLFGHGYLSQLEDNLPGMTHNPSPHLDQLHLKAA
jgi:hypothetical protein